MVEVLVRQCFAQSRLCGGSSALSDFQRVGLCLVFSPGWEGFPGRLPF